MSKGAEERSEYTEIKKGQSQNCWNYGLKRNKIHIYWSKPSQYTLTKNTKQTKKHALNNVFFTSLLQENMFIQFLVVAL